MGCIDCRRVFFEDLLSKAKEKQSKEEKRLKIVAEDFTDLLRSRHVRHDSVWDDVKSQIDHKERFKAVSATPIARSCVTAACRKYCCWSRSTSLFNNIFDHSCCRLHLLSLQALPPNVCMRSLGFIPDGI